MANPPATAADGGAPPAAHSPLPLKEAAAWNLTEKSIRETKLREALVALDSDRQRQEQQPSAAAAAHADASDTTTSNVNNYRDGSDEHKSNDQDERELNADEVDDIIAAARGILGQTLERIDPYPKRPAAHVRDSNNRSATQKANILFDPESCSIVGTMDGNAANTIGGDDDNNDEHDEIGTLDRFGVKIVRDDDKNNDEDCGMSLPSAINDSGSIHSTTVDPADGVTFAFADNVEHHRAVVMGSCPPSAENSVVGVGGGFGAGKTVSAANEGIKSSVFLGQLPPRPAFVGASQHVGGADVGHHTATDAGSSCGSSIATTELHSLRGGGRLLRIPPSRLPPGSQMDHSLATTVSNTHGDAMSVPRSEGTGAENESLAWRAALQDGPGRIRTTVEQEAPYVDAGRPPLGQIATHMSLNDETSSHRRLHHQYHHHSSGATITSTASSPVSTILSHNRTLQARAAHDAQRIEEMAVAEAEAREEVALLRAQLQQQTHHQYQGGSFITLQELRGEILHRTREELAAASGEVVRLRTELEEARSETETCQAVLSVENLALRDEICKLSAQAAQQVITSSSSGVGDGDDSAGIGPMDSNLLSRVTAAEATAAELRRQLEATKDTAERDAQRAARSERERDALQEEVGLAAKRLAAARDEVREVRRDRDGLRGELTELLRAKKNTERTADKEFGAEVERLRRLANQAKEDTEKKEKEMDRRQLQHEKDMEVVRNGEAIAIRDAEKLKRGLKTLVDQLRSLERAGELGNISVNQILITSQGNLSSSLASILMDDASASERKVTMTEKSTQASSKKEEAITESIGINTTVTSSFAANLFAEGLQSKADLRDAELRLSQLQLENTNLQDKCDRMNCQLIQLEEEKLEKSAALSAKIKEEDVEMRQLALLCEELKAKSAQLEQDNASLTEKQSYIEDQNRVLVRRAVELEELAEESQGDVERLTNELNSANAKLERHLDAAEDVKDLEDDKARMQAEWEEARRECELLQQEVLDATEKAGRYQEEEIELQSRIGTLTNENIDLSQRLQRAQKDLEAQRSENSTLGKSKLDYEWRCTNLGEEVAVLKEKLEFYQSSVDAREDKYNTLAAEKLDLENELNECRKKIALLSQVRDKAEADAKQLRCDNDAVKAELKVCAQEWRVVRDKFESVIEDKARLEKEVSDLEASLDACLAARADAEDERDRYCSENEAIKVELTSFRDNVNYLTDRLNHALDEKRKLEERMAESEREWRDACVQASTLIQSPTAGPRVQNPAVMVNSATSPFPVDSSPSPIATRVAHVQTDTWTTPGPVDVREPVGTIDATDDAVSLTVQSPPPVEASTANDVVNDMKAILSQIQSSLSASQAEAELSKLKSRLDVEKEVESLRISLETAEEHIVRLKTQIPVFHQEQGSSGGPSIDSAFDERILRIKEARERATLACAYQEKLAEITSPERREGATTNAGQSNNHRQLSDLSNNINTRQEDSSVRRETLKKSLAELRGLRKRDEERRMKVCGSKSFTSQQQRPLRSELAGSGSVNGRFSQQQPVYLLSPLPVSTINAAAASDPAPSSGMISPLPIDASMTTAQQLGTTSVEDIIDILESCS